MKKIAIIAIALIALTSCTEKFKRKIKDHQANWLGLERKVSIYNYEDAKPLRVYQGKIDVEIKENRVLFDLNGKRHVIKGGIVIIEEL